MRNELKSTLKKRTKRMLLMYHPTIHVVFNRLLSILQISLTTAVVLLNKFICRFLKFALSLKLVL